MECGGSGNNWSIGYKWSKIHCIHTYNYKNKSKLWKENPFKINTKSSTSYYIHFSLPIAIIVSQINYQKKILLVLIQQKTFWVSRLQHFYESPGSTKSTREWKTKKEGNEKNKLEILFFNLDRHEGSLYYLIFCTISFLSLSVM